MSKLRFYKYHLAIIVALCALFSSCIKDEILPVLVDDGTVMFVCEDSNPVTKTTLNGLQTEWVANTDKVGLFSPQASKTIGGTPGVVNEPLTALSNGARSQFSGTVYWNTGDHNFYSYYPYAAGTPPHTAVPVSLPADQTQSAGNNMNHLSALDFLVAKPYTAKYPGSSGTPATVSLRYNHLFSIIEFQIKRSSGIGAINQVRLRGTAPIAFESGTINLAQSVPTSGFPYVIDGMTNTSNSATVQLSSAINPGDVSFETAPKVYMVILPGEHTGDINIGFEVGGSFYEISKTNVTFERGKKYVIQTDVGNASIALIKGSDLEPVTINGVTWAPVNAGYSETTKYGLYYQWHRKYGHGVDIIETPLKETMQGPVSVGFGNLEDNRNIFFTNSNSPYSWINTIQQGWNASERYNPCPPGWRVPNESEFTGLISSGGGTTWVNAGTLGVDGLAGRWFGKHHNNPDLRADSCIFIPAAGNLSNTDGKGTGRGANAMCFTMQAHSGGYARVMSFTSITNPSTTFQKAGLAVSIRCVKKTIQILPIILTQEPFEVIHNSAKTGGIVEESGSTSITEKGIVYDIAINPTIAKTKVIAGSGMGDFQVTINGLAENTVYYLRCYAINSSGVTYGEECTFKTTPDWGGLSEVKVNGVTWAPVNNKYSGATPYGLMFQWARRAGQNYGPQTTASPASISTVNNAANDNIFYKPTSYPFDCNTTKPTSWTSNPCPTGWRLPTKAEIESLVLQGSTWVSSGVNNLPGRWFGGNHSTDRTGSVFFPASGMIDHNANSGLREGWGAYWTATSNGDLASALLFSQSTAPYVDSGRYRAGGYSLRCVKQ
ncbi:MAG: hypothetical protein CVU12_00605 [Bacteroidetes bacterium HGW-Bacteroidetes-7]|jgi:uncharacterized protein (TIGR02145 family)|nr:MAG: hypothetical protein CVU12_00605 [Bacteroidetes bacterium HGW-Bacteroidetes-7]